MDVDGVYVDVVEGEQQYDDCGNCMNQVGQLYVGLVLFEIWEVEDEVGDCDGQVEDGDVDLELGFFVEVEVVGWYVFVVQQVIGFGDLLGIDVLLDVVVCLDDDYCDG